MPANFVNYFFYLLIAKASNDTIRGERTTATPGKQRSGVLEGDETKTISIVNLNVFLHFLFNLI